MADIRRLVVAGRYENIPTITGFVGEAAVAAGLGEVEMFHCQMAVDEACTNIIEHAYRGEDIGEIEVVCSVEPGTCKIEITDHGRPFDPASIPEPKVGVSIDDVKPGGIGLHLMRQLMDEILFDFREQSNVLTMIKKKPAGTEPPQPQVDVPVEQPEPGISIVAPMGRLDSSAAPRLEEVVRELLAQGTAWLIIDLAGVTYISSRGLKVLVTAWRTARNAQGDVFLCVLHPPVMSVFETVGFTQIFEIFDTREQALAAMISRRSAAVS